jgi:hypothetical protein
MPQDEYSREEVVARGQAIYERDIHALVEPDHRGKLIVIDIESGDYEIDEKAYAAKDRLAARHPDGARCILRIGFPAAFRFSSAIIAPSNCGSERP